MYTHIHINTYTLTHNFVNGKKLREPEAGKQSEWRDG